MRGRGVLAVFLVATLLAGCATLPPAKPIQDLKSIAGWWEGTLSTPEGTFHATLKINEDGSYSATASGPSPGRVEGVLRLRDGKVLWFSRTTGRSGAFTLHEGDGKLILKSTTEGSSVLAEFRPVK